MKLIVILAVGERKWGDLALNLALSIKCNNPEQKIALIYELSAINGIRELIDSYCDYSINQIRHTDTPTEFAFWLKTQLYDIATQSVPDAKEIIYLDADTIMLPGKKVDEWFTKHEGRPFTSYCNDIYDFKYKKRKRRDYTFWCDPEKVKFQLDIPDCNKMPQINTSFIYFEKCELAKSYFKTVSDIWENDQIEYKEYKNTKPDELCFNIASALTNILPHQNTYRPIFFQFGSEQQSACYINHYYKAFGFAGETYPSDHLIRLYNETSDYYRQYFGIVEMFKFNHVPYEANNYLSIQPLCRRTLYRRGELENSEGGIFNPSAIVYKGELTTIYRKEAGISKSMYIGTSSTPHIEYASGESKELKTDADKDLRLEDFRLFEYSGTLMASHTVCSNANTSNIESKCGLSVFNDGYLHYMGVPDLPVTLSKVEKNWTFFSESDRLFCLYKLSPYTLFYSDDLIAWERFATEEKKLKWINDKFISNSTNPILIGDSYLVFFHSLNGQGGYYHGACLIDSKTKQLTHFTPRALNIVSGKEGLVPKITYVSGAVYFKDRDVVRAYCGEADSHSIYNEFNATKLIKEIKKYKC
jgi:hypothetical protein